MSDPQTDDATPEKRAAVQAYADSLPAKFLDLSRHFDEAKEHYPQHGNRGLGGWQCTCGRFAKFIRWQATGAPGYERGYLVNCKRCGEVLVY